MDPLGDDITTDPHTDKRRPHDAVLRVWHAATQASATHAVVLGDKEHPELYSVYNEGCVVDLAEEQMGDGGGDFCLENKVYIDLVPVGTSPAPDTSLRGATHGFGSTEERLIRANFGVEARDGEQRFDSATGTGAVRAHKGVYHDALFAKGNTLVLTLHNLWDGLAPGAVAHLYTLTQRARTLDRTVYVGPRARAGSAAFAAHYGERLSAAAVIGDASRCLRRLPALRQQATLAAQRAALRRANAPAAP